jgi:Tol biopolymer transport system component
MAAHAAGVIHRDLKSGNVMLVPSESSPNGMRAVITDFGLARSMTAHADPSKTPLTGEMKVVGTADYMAPEQLFGEEIDLRSDLYALGVVMFEMMTGKKPYGGDNPVAVLARRVSEAPPSPRELRPGLDERWERVILQCLERHPEDRPDSAWEVVLELSGGEVRFEPQSSGIVTRPPELGERVEPAEPPPAVPPPRRPRLWLPIVALAVLAVGLLAVAALQLRRPGAAEPPPRSFSPVQVTTAAGLELDPTFSPDGEALAYSSDQSGSFEIWIRELRPGGRESQLTSGGDQLFEPDWSPDGRTLVYHSKRRGGLWLVPADGGEPVRLTSFGSRPAFSPDGARIAFQSESSPQLSDTAAPSLALSTLWVVEADGEGLRQLTRPGEPPGGHGAPSWSPDGHRLVFSASRYGSSEIWSLELPAASEGGDGGEPVALVRSPTTAYDPAWSPDGRSIFFSARLRQVNGLWRLPVDPRSGGPDGEAEQIANFGLASIRQLAVSRRGGKVAYATLSTVSNLHALPLDPETGTPLPGEAGTPRALTSGTGRNNRPAFSPDGTRIAYDRWQPGVNIDLWLIPAGGGPPEQVTVDSGSSSQPSWFPDGERLAFHAGRDGRRSLWSIDLGSREESFLAELPEDVFWARLAPGGDRVAYHSRAGGGTDALWVIELATGERQRLTERGYAASFPCWSPDGEWLAFQSKHQGGSRLSLIPSRGGEPVEVVTDPGESWPYSFFPDGDRIAFAALRDGEWNLWWVSRRSGEQRRLTASPRLNEYLRYPLVSPGGDLLVYELARTTGDLFLVEELP